VKVRNNVNVLGDPKGPSVVLAHGFGCDQTMWRFLVPELVKTHQVILFDYTGSGQSTITDFSIKKYSRLEGYAQDIVDIIDFLSIKDVVVIGHSVSAIIAALASIKIPDVISKIVMICPSPCFANDLPDYEGGFERQDLENLLALMDKNYVDWANYLAPLVMGESNSEELTDELLSSFYKLEPLVAKTFARATFLSDYREMLPNISAQTLYCRAPQIS
jgi:sigma-B regulation protein RsbQ